MRRTKREIKTELGQLLLSEAKERGRHEVLMAQCKDVDACKHSIATLKLIRQSINTLEWVLNKRPQI